LDKTLGYGPGDKGSNPLLLTKYKYKLPCGLTAGLLLLAETVKVRILPGHLKIKNVMSKIDKKRKKLIARIEALETEMKNSLTKKDSNTVEISVGEYRRKIDAARKQLAELK
jgi:hypothetical protein